MHVVVATAGNKKGRRFTRVRTERAQDLLRTDRGRASRFSCDDEASLLRERGGQHFAGERCHRRRWPGRGNDLPACREKMYRKKWSLFSRRQRCPGRKRIEFDRLSASNEPQRGSAFS